MFLVSLDIHKKYSSPNIAFRSSPNKLGVERNNLVYGFPTVELGIIRKSTGKIYYFYGTEIRSNGSQHVWSVCYMQYIAALVKVMLAPA